MSVAKTPPMGWNSWDCYGASVNEDQLLGNARYMSKHLKEFGWEYVVCDIQWYEPTAVSTEYHPFVPLEMDEFSRLVPAPNRFPSSKGGKGFRPIADSIHEMGLKFGIHIMRGIPRQAVHSAAPIKNSELTARDIAHTFSICSWNTDMYGVNPDSPGAAAYYDSLFELYASWGVDFVKVDDIANTEFKPHVPYSAKREIELIRNAIDRCGREMVLSLSPGPAPLEDAEHLSKHANMWRMTGDFWDNWPQLYNMFERCYQWSPYVTEGSWPDCDMIPIGMINVNNEPGCAGGRWTNFTKDEQITLMTLWCIFRSPLMLGAELRELDDWSLRLITNPEVLSLVKETENAKQILRTGDAVIWMAEDRQGNRYVAFFNISFGEIVAGTSFLSLGINGEAMVRDLWRNKDIGIAKQYISAKVPPHGAVLYKLTIESNKA